jgi:hypothetical protein
MTKPLLKIESAASSAIKKLAGGMPIDAACRAVNREFGRNEFRRALRRHEHLQEAYVKARADYVAAEADELLRLADSGANMDRDQLAALKLRIDTRKWLAEKLLDDYQPKIKQEHSGAVPLIVETNVPRSIPEAGVIDAEIIPNIHDVL